jgi:hypothetical protein
MAYQFNIASSQHLSSASSPVAGVPITLACWARLDTVATGNRVLISVGEATSPSHRVVLLNTGTQMSAQSVGSADVRAQSSGGAVAAGTTYHFVALFESTTFRVIYINGVRAASNSSTSTLNTLNDVLIGARRSGTTAGLFMGGMLAEVGIWNTALTDDQIASLSTGMTCEKVSPQSLVFYAPLVRDLIDAKGGLTITNNNTATVANHPRVYA